MQCAEGGRADLCFARAAFRDDERRFLAVKLPLDGLCHRELGVIEGITGPLRDKVVDGQHFIRERLAGRIKERHELIADAVRDGHAESVEIPCDIIDLIKGKEENDRPTYLLVENVKNLLSINAGFDFATVLSEMDEAGYDCRWQVLNSKNFGVPQNRERVFIIANLRSRGRREILPLTGENEAALNQLVGGMQGYRVYGTDGLSATLVGAFEKSGP